MTAALVKIACAHCGGTVPTAVDQPRAECAWCGARLTVEHADGAFYARLAESADAITARARSAQAIVRNLPEQRALALTIAARSAGVARGSWTRIREPQPVLVWLLLGSLFTGGLALGALAIAYASWAWVLPALFLVGLPIRWWSDDMPARAVEDARAARAYALARDAHRARIDAVLGRDGAWCEPALTAPEPPPTPAPSDDTPGARCATA